MQLGGVNPTYRVSSSAHSAHRQHAAQALFLKAAPREHIAREVKAVAIARLMGLDRYVQRVWQTTLPGAAGAAGAAGDDRTYLAAQWMEGRAAAAGGALSGAARAALRALPEGDKAALLLHQYVIGDYDRHGGNWFLQRLADSADSAGVADERLIALDWGCAFGWPVRFMQGARESALLVAGWQRPSARWQARLSPLLLRHVAQHAWRIQRIAATGMGTRYRRSLALRLSVVQTLADMRQTPTLAYLASVAAATAVAEGLTHAPPETGMERYAAELRAYGY